MKNTKDNDESERLNDTSNGLNFSKCHRYLPGLSVTLAFAGSCAYIHALQIYK